MTAPRAFLCGTAKNEGPYILEWVAHHLELGFTDIALYQNDSDDLTHEIMKTLEQVGAIRYFPNPARRGAHQVKAYGRAAELDSYKQADYAMALDLDEMLVVKVGDGRLADLIAAAPAFDLMMANWRLFGSSGKKQQGFALQAERFTMADYVMADNEHFNAYKALFRPSLFSRPGIHKPPEAEAEIGHLRIVNGSGLAAGSFQVKNYNSTDPGGQSLVQINHYIVRDLASFLVKTKRGSAHQDDRTVGVKYWAFRNRNFVEDLSIQPYLPRIHARMQALDAAANGKLMRLRRQSIALHREKAVELLEEPDMQQMRRDCLKFEGHVPVWGAYHDHL
ncbi:glycosyltransferase family 2 protein [Gemmobacter serpentinus]|uniref:glycosyltransferase family 2 protein n=1 Tax=Gemmobacter serpentinus TaxID=2652247 RepID=UPI00124BF9BF|nr:glycosyltransferase family 2 protein [Gemmobacter serpentinus]